MLAGAAYSTLSGVMRSEEHTSELQSLTNLVCRLLLEKKKDIKKQARKINNMNYSHVKRYCLHSSV